MKKLEKPEIKITPGNFRDHLTGREGQIIEAAFECIVEKGIAAASTHAIAARAGLKQGIIHYYFRSKDELLKRVLEVFFQNAMANIEAAFHAEVSALEKLDIFLENSHSLIVARQEEWIVFNAFWAHAMSVGGDIQQMIQKQSRRFLAILIKIVRNVDEAGPVDSGLARDVAILMIGATQGLANIHALDPTQFDSRRLVRLIKDMVHGRLMQARGDLYTRSTGRSLKAMKVEKKIQTD